MAEWAFAEFRRVASCRWPGNSYNSCVLDIKLIREKPEFVRERLALRGAGDESLAREARAKGARACLAKPLSELDLLVSTIAAMLKSDPARESQS